MKIPAARFTNIGMTISDLSEESGVSKSITSNAKRGRNISEQAYKQITKCLDNHKFTCGLYCEVNGCMFSGEVYWVEQLVNGEDHGSYHWKLLDNYSNKLIQNGIAPSWDEAYKAMDKASEVEYKKRNQKG